MKCTRCSREYDNLFRFCPYCGERKQGMLEPKEKLSGKREGSNEYSPYIHTAPGERKAEKGGEAVAQIPVSAAPAMQTIDWRTVITIAVALIAVTGWVLMAVFIGSGGASDEAKTESVAEDFIENLTDEDYDAVFEQVDTADNPLTGLLVSQGLNLDPDEIFILEPGADLNENRDVGEYITNYLATTKKNLLKGNVKSLDSRKLEPEKNYVVAVYTFDSDAAFPLMQINGGGGWKVDLAALMVMEDRGTISQYVINSVEMLLSDPIRKNCEKAIEILGAASNLDSKYELWLKPEAEDLLEGETVAGLVEGEMLEPQLEKLMERARELEKKADSPSDQSTETSEPLPEPVEPEVITLTGFGNQATPPFEADQGLVIIHLQYQGGGQFSVTLKDQQGNDVGLIVRGAGPLVGSRAVGVSAGTYYLEVRSAGPWVLGVEEPAPVSAPYPPDSYAAAGPLATTFFQTRGGPQDISMEYQGEGDFVVTIVELGGTAVELVANERGPYSGNKEVSLRSDIYYLFDVQADGPWLIKIE
ncbi:MAG: hypothetical protein JXA49_02975 [Actinobacteria bacterium]|nr:hypothetical protein [Actinomycetota bacterium]